jgi:hypothetical protein
MADAPPAQPRAAPKVPAVPPEFSRKRLLGEQSGIEACEEYSKNEEALNDFLKLHPMLSLEAVSQKSMQTIASMIEKSGLRCSDDLPVIPKSYDDQFLRPPNKSIGERACCLGNGCMAQFVAKLRYGQNTPYAFTCTEFLMPDAREAFLDGKGLPSRTGKCLLCTRYFQNYIYLLSRTDPSFKVGESPLGMQLFANAIAEPASHDEARLRASSAELPASCSIVSAKDGYKASAMLFVDEDWADMRSSRDGKLGNLLWKPVVRFNSAHYKYERDADGPRIVQIGIGADDELNGLHFRQPPAAAKVALVQGAEKAARPA